MTEDKVLAFIRGSKEEYISGEEISRSLGISRAGIWKYIEKLRRNGYDITALPHLGYRLTHTPDKLIPTEISWGLDTKVMGRTVHCYNSTDSTNRLAYKIAGDGAKHGTVVFAEEQSAGRGRLGRSWSSPKGGIYMSVILRPRLGPQDAQRVTLCAACAAAAAIRKTANLRSEIKWPNDILVNRKKICGILTEMKAEQDRISFIILGIGVNVDPPGHQLPRCATSVRNETKMSGVKVRLAQEILRFLEAYYAKVEKNFGSVIEEWRNFSATLGKRVRVNTHEGMLEGQALDIDEHGALILRLDNGFNKHIISGDVEKCC
ncbi:MAG: biotin--[acetyl-CoA-carboxylase] ligase [Candidatus Omnitrophota bacterium]